MAGGAGFAVDGAAASGFAVEGAAGFAVGAGVYLPESNRLITSAVMSSDGSTKMAPASPALKSSPIASSFTTASTTGRSFSWNSACSDCCSSCTSALASSWKRSISTVSRSISRCVCARAASLSTAPPCCSFCWLLCSAFVFSCSSVDFFCVSACTLLLAALPSFDSAAIRCKSRNAILNGACCGGTAVAGQEADLLFHALSDETRLGIVQRLRAGERCVCELTDLLDAAQSRLSFHLKVLRDVGLVHDRRDGRWVYYSICPETFALVEGALEGLEPTAETAARVRERAEQTLALE